MAAHSTGEIIRVVKDENYSSIKHTGPRDARLSFGARGILVYLLTKPNNWNPTVEDLVNHAPEGKAAIRRMLGELKTHGYLKRERIKAERGRFIWQTTLFEVPQDEDFSHPKKTAPYTENQHMENHAQKAVSPYTDSPSMDRPYDGRPSHGKPVDIRSIEERSIEEEVLREVVEERAGEKTPPPPPPQSTALAKNSDSPIMAAIFKVTGRIPNPSDSRDKLELAKLAQILGDENFASEAAAAAAIVSNFENWPQLRTPPHLSQIVKEWHPMKRMKNRQENNAIPIPKTANERRLEQHVRERLERVDNGAQSSSADASLERLAQRR